MKKDDVISKTVTHITDAEPIVYNLEAVVNWVVGDEAGISYLAPPDWKGGGNVINLVEEPDWKVIRESVPSFQSSVANMSEEDLRGSIDKLRESRKHIPAPRSRSSRVKADDPLAKAFGKMSKEKRAEIMKKLGLT